MDHSYSLDKLFRQSTLAVPVNDGNRAVNSVILILSAGFNFNWAEREILHKRKKTIKYILITKPSCRFRLKKMVERSYEKNDNRVKRK
jgi:hypothetical protein